MGKWPVHFKCRHARDTWQRNAPLRPMRSNQMAKRKREPVALTELDSLGLDEFTTKLKEGGGRDLVAKVALAIPHLGCLTATDLQTFSEAVPAFSKARWDKVALKFGLDVSRDIYQLETFSVPCLSLPPSFHREAMRNSAQWLDVYQEAGSHNREAARLRLMDAALLWLGYFTGVQNESCKTISFTVHFPRCKIFYFI